MKEKNGDNTRTIDAKVIEIKEKTILVETEEGEQKEFKKEILGEDVEKGDILEVVIKDKPLNHKVTKAKLITKGESSIELLKLLGLASVILVICFILLYSGFISYWYGGFKDIMMNGTHEQTLNVANIMANLMGIFIIATAFILTIIWRMYIRDDEMKSDDILKLLGIVTIATVVCYAIVYFSFYNGWADLFKTVMSGSDLTSKLIISEIMTKILGSFVIGSLLILNIVWGFYTHHKEILKIEEVKE